MSKQCDVAYKLEVCKQVESGWLTVGEISKETGISENTLYGWLKNTVNNKETPFVGSGYVLSDNRLPAQLKLC